MVCTGSTCLWWSVGLEELVVDQALNSTISCWLHHERRWHVEHLTAVASLVAGIVVVEAVVKAVVLVSIARTLVSISTVILVAILSTIPILTITVLVVVAILLIVITTGLTIPILVAEDRSRIISLYQ